MCPLFLLLKYRGGLIMYKMIDETIKYIMDSDYGDIITHEDMADLLELSKGSQLYYFAISRMNKTLLNKSKMLVNIPKVGYQIVKPDDYSGCAVKTYIKGVKKMKLSKKILEKAPTDLMSQEAINKHNMVYDRVCAKLANADAGVKELKKITTNTFNVVSNERF